MTNEIDLELHFDRKFVGRITGSFVIDGTWYGTLLIPEKLVEGDAGARVVDFVRVSEQWNERLEQDEDPDPDEFSPYSDILNGDRWSVRDGDGNVFSVTGAPVFRVGGDVSWRQKDLGADAGHAG